MPRENQPNEKAKEDTKKGFMINNGKYFAKPGSHESIGHQMTRISEAAERTLIFKTVCAS